MTFNDIYELSLSFPGATEDFPFGEQTLVFKVAGRMFGLIGLENVPPRMNLKCDPERALELRERYDAIIPGYHMNKVHWNTVIFDGTLPEELERELIEESYRLVVEALPKGKRPG